MYKRQAQKEKETCVFTPIGKQALLSGTATILRIVRPRPPPQTPSLPSTPDVSMGASPSTPILAEPVPGGALCGTAQGSPASEAGELERAEEVGSPAEAEAEAAPRVGEVQEAPAEEAEVVAPPVPAAPADGDSGVDEQARLHAAQVVGFSRQAAIRSAVFGKVSVRGSEAWAL